MKRVIYTPGVDEKIPDGAYSFTLPIVGQSVIDVLIEDKWDTDGTVLHEQLEDGTIIKELPEPSPHTFAGW